MLDLSHIPNSQQDIQIFNAIEGTRSYQTWRKPKKCSFVYVLSIDGGAGGCSGISITTGSSFVTSCGGGSGGVTRALINSSFVPDVLFIKVGKGGRGGAVQVAGSYQTGFPGESSGIFCLSNLASQANGNRFASFIGGTTSAVGGDFQATAAGSVASSTSNVLIGLTNVISLAGRTATGGGVNATSNMDPLTSHLVTAGCPGGSYNGTATAVNGGGINASSISPPIPGGAGGSTLGGNGANGITSWKPFYSLGGAGGGNSHTPGGVAGAGGNGGIGSGGGGGGSATAGTPGKGGDGGDGIVIIISF
jgi:hypothetical protein